MRTLRSLLLALTATPWATLSVALPVAPANALPAQHERSGAAAPPTYTEHPTFTEHIAPIVFGNCSSCHRPGEAGPFSLLSYRDVHKRGRNLLAVIEDRFMPPWHPAPGYGSFRNELRLRDAEIETFRAWVEAGMPEGPAAALPPLPAFPDGWQLGEPDLVVSISAAFEVPAAGPDIYRNFALAVDLPEDKWLTAIEVRPSARAVLHHVLVFVDDGKQARDLDGRDGRPGFAGMRQPRGAMIGAWAVGGLPQHLPEGLATRLPKGSDLLLQSHLHPSGKTEHERTTIGLYFADAEPKRSLTSIQLPPFFGIAAGLDIPAGDDDYRLSDQFELPCAVDAVAVGGHAHMLCRALRMHATLPDGSAVPLLHIPQWDFDWQNRYTFRELVRLPAGAVVHAELRYDNSDQNPDNPFEPPQRVRWGRETTDEMGSVTLLVTPADEGDLPTLQRALRTHQRQSFTRRAAGAIEQQIVDRFDGLDQDGDGRLSRGEVPRQLRRYFDRLDGNKDGGLSRDEAAALARLLGGNRRRDDE